MVSASLSLFYRCVSLSLPEASQCLSLVLSCGSLSPSCSEPLSPACSQASVRAGDYPVAPASDTTAGDRLCPRLPGEHRPCLVSPALLLSQSSRGMQPTLTQHLLRPFPHLPTPHFSPRLKQSLSANCEPSTTQSSPGPPGRNSTPHPAGAHRPAG